MAYPNLVVSFLLLVFLAVFQVSISANAAGLYEGERNTFNRFHGQGTYTSASGKKYVGQWLDGRRSGKGTQIWPNGDKYMGKWSGNRANGQGEKRWTNGDWYVGTWVGGKFSGAGYFVWANSDEYKGGYLQGKRHGKGMFKSKGIGQYQGEWKADKKHGKGELIKLDGSVLTGQWNSDFIVGDAVYVFKNGDQYTGPIVKDSPHGEGVCKDAGKLSPCTYNNGKRGSGVVANTVAAVPPAVVSSASVPTKAATPTKKSAKAVPAESLLTTPVVRAKASVVKETEKDTVNLATRSVSTLVSATPKVKAAPLAKPSPRSRSALTLATKPKVKENTPIAEFLTRNVRSNGSTFSFYHDWFLHGYYAAAPKVWAKRGAGKTGALKIGAVGGDYELTLVIENYTGVGSYSLPYFKAIISKPFIASYQTTSALPGSIEIKYDDGKMIGGTFEFIGFRNGDQVDGEKRTISAGEFLVPVVYEIAN